MESESLGVDPRNLHYLEAAQVILMDSRSGLCFPGGLAKTWISVGEKNWGTGQGQCGQHVEGAG